VQYPAPGDPELARRVQEMLKPLQVKFDGSWGSITEHGLYFGTYIPRQTYPSRN
jgi:4,5-DOPA dioxygenase extradiol